MIRTVFVTWANSGIGLATSLHLAGFGFRVVGTVRSDEKGGELEKAASKAGVVVRATTAAAPRQAAEGIGEAFTAGRTRAHYREGADAPVIELLDVVLPDRLTHRLARTAVGT